MIVGLTGGIGSGKTTVGSMFSELGIPVYNSDVRAKELMHSSEKLKEGIQALLGNEAYIDQKLNTQWVAQQIFNDKGLLQKMNNLVHPAVKMDFMDWAKQQKSPFVIQENPLIFETGSENHFDKIILVEAPLETRIKRVILRNGTTRENVLERIANQMQDVEKQKRAHFVIHNTDKEKTAIQVLEIYKNLLEQSSDRS